MLNAFFVISLSVVDNKPLIQENCSIDLTKYFDIYEYQCKNCPSPFTSFNGKCQCSETTPFYNPSNNSCVSNCQKNLTAGYVCLLSENDTQEIDSLMHNEENMIFYDLNHNGREGTQISCLIDLSYQKFIEDSAKECYLNHYSQNSCEALLNACVLNAFSEESTYCQIMKIIFSDNIITGQYNYRDWPTNSIFYKFRQSFNQIQSEDYVSNNFDYNSQIDIYLARFSRHGEYKGMMQLKSNLQKCGYRDFIGQIWRKFGNNYNSKCNFNLTEIIDEETTDFFEPFISDGNDNNFLRPIPVLVKTYRQNGINVNRENNKNNYQFFRRFFLFDNYSTRESNRIIQYAKDISLVFEVHKDDHKRIYPPYIEIDYEQMYLEELSSYDQRFSFHVSYELQNDYFWTLVIVIYVVSAIIAISFFVVSYCF